jgi:4-O-beta-D-mannosyl-D-glucose phosphorylase
LNDNGGVYIYYASSDTRIHVATTTLDQLIDYVMNTPPDGFTSAETVKTLNQIIENNQSDIIINAILSSPQHKKAK